MRGDTFREAEGSRDLIGKRGGPSVAAPGFPDRKEIAMRTSSRFAGLAPCAAALALVAGCTTERTVVQVPPAPIAVAPAVVPAPVAVAPIPAVEYGRIT